jgi:cytochrome-b5 reductase
MGEEISRKYTPISHIFSKGYFDLLIKVYHEGVNSEYPEGGKMSQWLDQLKIGENVIIRGPIGRLFYYGDGRFKLGTKEKPVVWREKTYKNVGMLCGGTGITPLYQLLLAASINSDSKVQYSMIFGNRSSADILLKEELDQLLNTSKLNFKLQHTIDKSEENWTGLVGYITRESIEKYIFPPGEDTLILLCGRAAMCKKYLFPILLDMGYKQQDIFIF